MDFLIKNLGTIIVLLLLLAAVAGIAFRLLKNQKQGKSSCGCSCGGCENSSCASAQAGMNKKIS